MAIAPEKLDPPIARVDEVEALLRSVAIIVKKRGRDILGQFEITPPQFEALLFLRDNEGMTMGELCQKMYLACSTATDLIDRMERNGLIERMRDRHDRRVVRLRVLKPGYQIIEEVMRARRAYLQTILEQIEPGEADRLVSALKQLHELMTRECCAN